MSVEVRLERCNQSWPRLWPLGVLALAAFAIWPTVGLVDDVSWLITVCERILDGQKLYVDVIEANPPASVWIYLPAVALARALATAPEIVINLQMLMLLICSLWLSTTLLNRADLLKTQNQPLLLALVTGVLMLLPNGIFGQREHVLLLLLLPVLSSLCLRVSGQKPDLFQGLMCGVLAGVAMSIKAHYIFAVGFSVLAAATLLRSWRVIFALELWVMGLTFSGYILVVFVLAPQFLSDILPILSLVYLPIRRPIDDLIFSIGIGTVCAAALLTLICSRRHKLAPPVIILLCASLGSTLPFFIQGKNWPNHIFPMVRFSLLALTIVATDTRIASVWHRSLALIGVLLIWQPTSNWLKDVTGATELRHALQQAQPNPKMLYIGHILRYAHPLVRQLHGTYVGRVCYQWITIGAEQRKAETNPDVVTLAKLNTLIEQDRQWLIADLRQNNPDIVLVQIAGFDWSKWIEESAELKTLLQGYKSIGTFDGVEIMQNTSPAQ